MDIEQASRIRSLYHHHLQHKFCWWLVPSYLVAEEIWLDLVEAVQDLKNVSISTSKRRSDLPKGGVIATALAWFGAQATTRNLIDFA